MRVFHCDHIEVSLPAGHRFPMGKYAALRRELISRGVVDVDRMQAAALASRDELESAHTAEYTAAILDGGADASMMRPIGLPWSEALALRARASVGGTMAAARAALEDGIAGNLAGGTHHAFASRGAGFCVFNDLAVTARVLREAGEVGRVLILDLDVHQGDGTAAILGGEVDVFTCSVHGEKNFPFQKQRSHLDVPLPDGASDAVFLEAVEHALSTSLSSGAFDLVLYQAGVDALATDRLGRLEVSQGAMRERDRRVLRRLRGEGVPVALTLGGGYSDPIGPTIEAHMATYEEARALASS